jgi:hypothetical protein
MSTSLAQIAQLLDDLQLNFTYRQDDEFPHIGVDYVTDFYVNGAGEKLLTLMIDLASDGDVVNVVAPRAFIVEGENLAAAAIAAGIIQWRTRFVQFEFDHEHGEIRPCVELPLEDAHLTARQIQRCMGAVFNVVEVYCGVLDHACKAGKIDFELYNSEDQEDGQTVSQLSAMLSEFTPDQIAHAVAATKAQKKSAG